jgi:hypothetical protein
MPPGLHAVHAFLILRCKSRRILRRKQVPLSGQDYFSRVTLRPRDPVHEIACLDNTKNEMLKLAKPKQRNAKDSSLNEYSLAGFRP